jgi:hypothetical protein
VPLPEPSHFRAGDWLVVPNGRGHPLAVDVNAPELEPVISFALEDPLPFRTLWCYYVGRTPLERHRGPRLVVVVYRVTADFVPRFAP